MEDLIKNTIARLEQIKVIYVEERGTIAQVYEADLIVSIDKTIDLLRAEFLEDE